MQYYRLNEFRSPGLAIAFLLLVTVFCLTCGPQVIQGRPPFISMSGVYLNDDKLSVEFDIRNQNGVPMTVDTVEITVTVSEVELARVNRKDDLTIGANSAEQVHVEELPAEGRLALLESLENGDVKSLPFSLKGRVHTVEDGYLSYEQTGYLFPVPGRPGNFRATVTQAKGLQRDEKL
jgi:hypothetical protein